MKPNRRWALLLLVPLLVVGVVVQRGLWSKKQPPTPQMVKVSCPYFPG